MILVYWFAFEIICAFSWIRSSLEVVEYLAVKAWSNMSMQHQQTGVCLFMLLCTTCTNTNSTEKHRYEILHSLHLQIFLQIFHCPRIATYYYPCHPLGEKIGGAEAPKTGSRDTGGPEWWPKTSKYRRTFLGMKYSHMCTVIS